MSEADNPKQKLREYFQQDTGTDFGEVGDDDNLFENGVLDSFGIVKLVSFLEQAYQCNFEVEELTVEQFSSLNTIAALLQRKINA